MLIITLISCVIVTIALIHLPIVLAQNTSPSVNIPTPHTANKNDITIAGYEEAIKYYDKALAIEPNSTTLLDNKGMVLMRLGNYIDAIKYFDKVLSINPNDVAGLYNKAVALNKLGKHTQSEAFRNKASQINPSYSGEFINELSIANKLAKPKDNINNINH